MPKGIPNKRYTPEFKRLVVETMREEDLSVREAMRRFEINDHGSRPAKMSKTVEEDLIAENQRLRAENDYLKNLQALVLEEERRRHKKRRWSKS